MYRVGFKQFHDVSGHACYQGIKLANEMKSGWPFYSYLELWQQTIYIDDGCKRLFCVNVKGLYWFAFEQN